MHSYICNIHTYTALYPKITPCQTDICTNGSVSTLRNHVGISTEGHAASGIQCTQV